jgi:hypothetical protein
MYILCDKIFAVVQFTVAALVLIPARRKLEGHEESYLFLRIVHATNF